MLFCSGEIAGAHQRWFFVPKLVRERLCSAQLEKRTISLSQAQNGHVIAQISFLCPRKISSKLCPEWRVGAPSTQLEAVLKGGQLSLCVAQPCQGKPAKIPLWPLDSSSFQAFLKASCCPLQGRLLQGMPIVSRSLYIPFLRS